MLKTVNMGKLIYRSIKIPFYICISLLLVSQIVLLVPAVSNAVPVSAIIAEEDAGGTHTGKIIIQMESGHAPHGNIKIMVNGTEAVSMSSEVVELSVMNNSVIEIDGRRVNYPFGIRITAGDKNTVCEGEYARVEGNLVQLSRVFVVKNN